VNYSPYLYQYWCLYMYPSRRLRLLDPAGSYRKAPKIAESRSSIPTGNSLHFFPADSIQFPVLSCRNWTIIFDPGIYVDARARLINTPTPTQKWIRKAQKTERSPRERTGSEDEHTRPLKILGCASYLSTISEYGIWGLQLCRKQRYTVISWV
jgi:hypothetical protein